MPIDFAIHRALPLAAALALPALTWAPNAAAVDLQPASFREVVLLHDAVANTDVTAVGASALLPESVSTSVTPGPGSFISGYANVTGGLQPSLEVSASASGSGGTSLADARIRYHVRLEGAAGTSAPMLAITSAWATASSDPSDVASSYAQLTLSSPSGSGYINISRQVQVYTLNQVYADAFSEAIPFTMYAGVTYTVDMVGVAQSNRGVTTAYVDPSFQFAAGFDSTNYQLSFSPNLITAVPEPGSAALWLLGMAGLAVAWRRRGAASEAR